MSYDNAIIDKDIKALMESAAIGEAARSFMESGLGKHIINTAAEDVDSALFDLIETDPSNQSEISRLQTEIKVARLSVAYLMNSITAGENSIRMMEDE